MGFELQQPGPPPTGYDGAHHLLPRVGVEVFQKTMSVVPEGKTGELASIFPQKSDLVRAIVGLNKFLPLEHEPTVVLRGLNGGDDYQFLNRHREWLENEMPSLKSEKIKLTGMLKAGALGKKSVFRIFDGIRTITLLPSSDQTIDFRDLFGKVVELNGVAKYKPNGQISGVEEIENLAPHTHKVSSVESGERRFVFSRELSFSIDASTSEAGFLLSNQDLDIHSYGQSLREATEGISEQVEFLWDEYAQCDDNALHSSGKTLKDRILGIVEKVGPLNE
ncbi:MAG: hypothetical protein HN673_01730 [Rhodospirillales bacterium]|nr:hypothetical protein [Rhodospirillales bacterium]